MTHNISRMIALSTGHLTWSTVQLLEHTPISSSHYPVMGGPIPYGFFVYAHDEQGDGPDAIPEDLWACCEFARAQGCDYIRFDAEEDVVDELPDHTATHPGGPSGPPPSLEQAPLTHLATFVGEAWINNHAVPVDDAEFEYAVSAQEIADAGGFAPGVDPEACEPCRGDWDALKSAAMAPDMVRHWNGPFTIAVRALPSAFGDAAASADPGEEAEACSECGTALDDAGDGYDGRCPSCADRADPSA